jgi:AcrR family transcriptional regulator
MSVKSLRAENAEKTRVALMDAGRELFAERGFAGVSAEEIVAKARVTRGALYHHFKDKKDLFGAVCDEVGAELAKRIEDAALPLAASNPLRAFVEGVDAFFEACAEGEFLRIVIVDAPSIEGWEEWRKHAEMHELGLIKLGLQLAMDAGQLRKLPVDTLAPLIFGMLNEGGMLIGRAQDKAKARREISKTFRALIEGLSA